MIIKILRTSLLILVVTLAAAFLLPNLFNDREKKAFSDEYRLYSAKQLYNVRHLGDSATVLLSDFYNRGAIATRILGDHYRTQWATPVNLPVFEMDTIMGGLTFEEVGGGQQTFSVKLKNESERTYTLRSVNKDQSRALPVFLQYSFLRPLFRDQASALNPFGALVTERFEKALDILHTSPTMYFIPYDSTMTEVIQAQLSGRVMILEEEPDKSWTDSYNFNHPDDIISTKEVLTGAMNKSLVIDSLEYLKARLLDFTISDWDRHGGQYEWAVYHSETLPIARPIVMDRDMAFFKFDDGLLNQVALAINNKFQSFNAQYDDISGLIRNSKDIDRYILRNVSLDQFISQAEHVQNVLSDSVIDNAFRVYPESVYRQLGEKHVRILKERRAKLDSASVIFHTLINH
ncbi:hypothetical protein LVD17_18560 [Fulvivirga ulvae]|uniref:hypothetical protein n=1 Tax=Fulvivirga ulvae TaxID=2904245 RepID=UPI001F284AD5|nr:hypothetical protein [Fulvivirga ulvae]UII30299.1 hypothetical protein LVD17_18560 [Fulvivirga ulvae]